MATGNVHHLLLMADPSKAKGFYTKLFGWKYGPEITIDGKNYVPWDDGTGPGGYIVMPDPAVGADWIPFIEVVDAAASAALAVKELGSIVKNVSPWIGKQKIAIIKDSTGVVVGLWQP